MEDKAEFQKCCIDETLIVLSDVLKIPKAISIFVSRLGIT